MLQKLSTFYSNFLFDNTYLSIYIFYIIFQATGVTSTEKVTNEKSGKGKKQQQPPHKSIESECDFCRANLYISMVRTDEGNIYCLQHALKNLNNGNIQAKQCKLIYAYNIDDIETLIKNLKERIQQKRAIGKKQK